MNKEKQKLNMSQNPKLIISILINRFLDKILLLLIYRRWGKLRKKIDGKTFLSSDYAKRRKSYESLMWEVRKNDL
jgi:hypothetical protein